MRQYFQSAAIVAVCTFLCLVLWDVHREMPLVHSALWNVASASYDLKQNSGAELQETRKATAATKEFFDRTGWALNGRPGYPGLLPTTTALIAKSGKVVDHLDDAVIAANRSLLRLDELLASGKGTMDELTAAVGTFRGAVRDLDGLIADPAIRATLDNLAMATADLDATIKQLDAMLKSGTATAEDIRQVADKIREQYTKAKNLYYAIFKELLSVGSQGVQFFLTK